MRKITCIAGAIVSSVAISVTWMAVPALAQANKPDAKQAAPAKWPAYQGKSFKVDYPAGWKPQTLVASTPAESDSAIFASPDGQMQFYIFSPQWDGTPPGIAIDAVKEVETARKTEPGISSGIKGHYTWYTIAAKDKSYSRTYQSFKAISEPVHWVIGMKYANDAALGTYRADYARFKKSLEQFAD